MASNRWGNVFTFTTWGESHGPAIGVVIDGCPAGLKLDVAMIQKELDARRPGLQPGVSARKEPDQAQILSGVFEGQTTGAPISIMIPNKDAQTSAYEPIKDLLRPGHANYTYLEKYGVFDYRGGGRASARETAGRVAAGAVAKALLSHVGIFCKAYLKSAAGLCCSPVSYQELLQQAIAENYFCPDPEITHQLKKILSSTTDSYGGIVEWIAHVPTGLGEPVYEKIEANLAKAMLSIPASKGFEIGDGFEAAKKRGSESNDLFTQKQGQIALQSNHAGGTLGGITTGQPLVCRVAFKPTSSLLQPQKTVTLQAQEALLELPEGSRHDPCLCIRAVPVVEAMGACVLADAYLMNRLSKL